MQIHLASDDVTGWASRTGGTASSRTARVMSNGAEKRAPRAEVLIRLHDLRGAILAIRDKAHGPNLPETRTVAGNIAYGSPNSYRGLLFVVRG
jgi:hypothetical protein